MLSDPAAAAWVAAGRPAVNAPTSTTGPCGRCGSTGPTVASSNIISEKFTGFDAWPYGSRRLCLACAWAYSRPPRAVPTMVITANAVIEQPKSDWLSAFLTSGALPDTHAVILPSTHRRHILAAAEWGHLATDGLVLRWDAAAAARLADLAVVRPTVTSWVKALAATAPMNGRQIISRVEETILLDVPPYPLLRTLPRQSWPGFMEAWKALQPWRAIPPLWAALRNITNG